MTVTARGTAALVLLILAQVVLVVTAARQQAEVPVEPDQAAAGAAMVALGEMPEEYAAYPVAPWLTGGALLLAGATPVEQMPAAEGFFFADPAASHDRLLYFARLPTVLAGVLMCALVALLTQRRWGWLAAFAGTAVAAFTPEVLDHSQWASGEMAAAAALLGTSVALAMAARTGSLALDAVAGAAIGVALGAGPGGLVAAVTAVVVYLASEGARLGRLCVRLLVCGACAGLVLLAVYLPLSASADWLDTTRALLLQPADPNPWVETLSAMDLPMPWMALFIAGTFAVLCSGSVRAPERLALILPVPLLLAASIQGMSIQLSLVPYAAISTAALVASPHAAIRVGGLLAVLACAASGITRYPHLAATDRGQGLPALAEELSAREIPEVALAYAGVSRPEHYGIRAVAPTTITPGWYAASRSILDGTTPAVGMDVAWLDILTPEATPNGFALFDVDAADVRAAQAWTDRNEKLMEVAVDLLHNEGQPGAALALLDAVLAGHPRHYGALYQRAVSLDHLDRGDEALDAWRRFLVSANALNDRPHMARAGERIDALSAPEPDEPEAQD